MYNKRSKFTMIKEYRKNSECIGNRKNRYNFVNQFILESKTSINNLKLIIRKFNKLYALCKSKKVDKINKFHVTSHKINNFIKKRKYKIFKYKYQIKRKRKSKLRRTIQNVSTVKLKSDEIVRDKILRQLELLRNSKNVDNPFINLKSKIYLTSINKDNDPSKNNEDSNLSFDKQSEISKPSTSHNVTNNINVRTYLANCGRSPETSDDEYTTQIGILDKQNVIHSFEKSNFKMKTPTKTNDVTKIKGWRRKSFLKVAIDSKNEIFDENSSNVENLNNLDTTLKSAFESEALDQFLSNNSKLNISYEVPKLIAEEAISMLPSTLNEFTDIPNKLNSSQTKPLLKLEKRCKAKTLAEKRKMMECDRQKDLLHEMEISESTLLKQLKRDEKRHRSETINEIRNRLKIQNMPVTRDCWITVMKTENNQSISQMVEYGKDNIRITGSYGGPSFKIIDNKRIQINSDFISKNNIVILDELNCREVTQNFDTILKYNSDFCQYKPGPLSKKPFLDKFVDTNWETVIIPLPKVSLEVHPELGKKIHPTIERYIQMQISENGFISDLWAKFATSAVVSDENNKQHFDFPLKYANNQEKILMKKEKPIKIEQKLVCGFPEILESKQLFQNDFDSEIQQIMNDILKYFETPTLDNSNIPFCPDCPEFKETEKVVKPINPITADVHAVLSSSRKRKQTNLKTERELKRLNVQVIEIDLKVDTKTKSIRSTECMKLECRLGCVCNDSDADWPQHCGRELCIFKCECRSIKMINKEKGHQYISLPEGADLLSVKTMDQIRDQAKRNLAKEERKFTQTVIKANDQTIVVGEGCRERRQRVKRIPQKYVDSSIEKIPKEISEDKSNLYTEEHDLIEFDKKRSIRIWEKQNKKIENVSSFTNNQPSLIVKQEIVPKMENLTQLINAVPWCMVHNLYKCFCNGHDLENNLIFKPKKVLVEKETEKNHDYIEYSSKRSYASNHGLSINDANLCARIRGVPNFYLSRNKSQYFKTRNVDIAMKEIKQDREVQEDSESTENDEIQVVSDDPLSTVRLSPEIEPVDKQIKTKSKSFALIPNEITPTENLTFKNDVNVDKVSRPTRVKKLSTKYNNTEFIAGYLKFLEKGKNIQVNEIKRNIIPEKEMKRKKVEKKNANNADWNKIEEIPQEDKIDTIIFDDNTAIPFVKPIDSHQPLRIIEDRALPDLLVPTADIQSHLRQVVFKTISKRHIFRMMPWEKLNKHFHKNNLFIWYNPSTMDTRVIASTSEIDRPSMNYINVKKFKHIVQGTHMPEILKGLIHGKLPGKAYDSKNTYAICVFNGKHWEIRGTILKKPTDNNIVRDEQVDANQTLKANNILKTLNLEAKEIPLAIAEPQLTSNPTLPTSIRVPIPIGQKDSRWFMLILENDFSVLRINHSDVAIKYGQLKQACQFAMRIARTVRFLIPRKSPNIDSGHPAFGGYAVPGLLERIFFGPYNLVENHGIITYRYMNGQLMDCNSVAQLTGLQECKRTKGIWLYTKGGNSECTDLQVEMNTAMEFVDLTENDEDDEVIVSKKYVEPSKKNFDSKEKTNNSEIQIEKMEVIDDHIEKDPLEIETDTSMPILEKIDNEHYTNEIKKMPKLQPMDQISQKLSNKVNNTNSSNKNSKNQHSFSPSVSLLSKSSKLNNTELKASLNENHTSKFLDSTTNSLSDDNISNSTKSLGSINKTINSEIHNNLVSTPKSISMINKSSLGIKANLPLDKSSNSVSLLTKSLVKPTTSLPIDHSLTIMNRKKKRKNEIVCNQVDDDLEIISSTISSAPKERVIWLIPEIKSLGYIEVTLFDNNKISLTSPITQKKIFCADMESCIQWIDSLLKRHIHFIPKNFQIRLFMGEDKKMLAGRRPLDEDELRGYHMICEKGLYDITSLTMQMLNELGISAGEQTRLLSKKQIFIEQKYIYMLGEFFLPIETMRSMLNETIINMTPSYIRRLQKENISLKREKINLTKENKKLKLKLNALSKTMSSDTVLDDEDDDDVIFVEANESTLATNSTSLIKSPTFDKNNIADSLETGTSNESNLIITNVTSLSKEYKQEGNFEQINQSCKIIGGKQFASSSSSSPSSSLLKKPVNKSNKIISLPAFKTTNRVLDSVTKSSPLLAPVVLPDGKQLYIPIDAVNCGKKILVSKSALNPVKTLVTVKNISPPNVEPRSLLSKKINSVKIAQKSRRAKTNCLITEKNSTPSSKIENGANEIIEID